MASFMSSRVLGAVIVDSVVDEAALLDFVPFFFLDAAALVDEPGLLLFGDSGGDGGSSEGLCLARGT